MAYRKRSLVRRLIEHQIGLSGVAETARRVSALLTQAGLRCALVGGYAVHLYGYSRFTHDVDFVVDDRESARQILIRNGFKPIRGSNMSLKDPRSETEVDLLQAGVRDSADAEPYPKPAPITRIGMVRVIRLDNLLAMKLSSFLASPVSRKKDQADVVEIIKERGPPLGYLDAFPPRIATEYRALWNGLADGR